MKFLKKIRKEVEKWLNIPKILKANKVYISELKIANDRIEFLESANKNKDTENLKLRRIIEDFKSKAS